MKAPLLLCFIALFSVFAVAQTGQQKAREDAREDTRKSGADFMSLPTRAMQTDDVSNPAMLWVEGGKALWSTPAGQSEKSCMSCHADASVSMKGVAASYPAFDRQLKHPINLNQRINQCRVKHQKAEPLAFESEDLLSLESYVAKQSQGLPIKPMNAPTVDANMKPFLAKGEQLFQQRMGQLNMSCAQCHDGNAGQRLASSLIPQAHPDGYPIYRLEWQTMGSLQRRLRNCMSGVRAEAFDFGAPELVALEVYLAERARGMPLQAPGVRP
jgi:sulfur-oxidizing protein SoxA